MSAAAARIRAFFFESTPGESVTLTQAPVLANRVAVLGRANSIEGAAAALALRSMSDLGARCALLARWQVRGRVWRLPPARGAARAAGVLRDRGLPAVASGRLVRLDLSAEAAAAASELARASAVIDGPAVLVVGSARDEAVDRVLLEHDELVLVGDEEVLMDRLAAQSLAELGLPMRVVAPLTRWGFLALAGLAAVPAPSRSGADA